MKKIKIKAIDVFSGGGGVSIGLTQAGFKVVTAVEIDKTAADTYKSYRLLKHVNVLQKDICELNGRDILAAGKIKRDELFLLAGCPPCQKFSMQNRRNNLDVKAKDDVKKLLMQFLRIIQEIHPPFVLLENVPGILSSYKGDVICDFLRKLENSDSSELKEQYVVKYGVLNAADYGVPQLRKRFVLHAVRKDIFNILKENQIDFSLPVETHSNNKEDGLKPWVTVRKAFRGLPPIVAGQRYSDGRIKNHYAANLSEINLLRMRIIRTGGGCRTALPQYLVLECHKNHGGHKDAYGILNPDSPSPTLTGGCISFTKGRFGHPFEERAISVREAARLQTFPDDYVFGENMTKAALEIGNAVPVKLVTASGRTFFKIISEINPIYKKENSAPK